MSKEFKTTSELISIMETRGIQVDSQTEIALFREGYYPVVNGYKDPFLDCQAMSQSNEDVYLPGTQFTWIYSLFCFDRDLRHIVFKYLLKAESIMKTSVVQAFCDFYQLQKRSVQNRACKLIGRANEKPLQMITPLQLLRAFSVLVDFRNICAHGERLYCTKVGKSGDVGFTQMLAYLQLVLPESDYASLLHEIAELLNQYEGSLHAVEAKTLLQGVPFV